MLSVEMIMIKEEKSFLIQKKIGPCKNKGRNQN